MLKDLWVPGFVSSFSNLRESKIHGWTDYVSCAYSVFIFMICSALTGWALNFKKPIDCLTPAQFPDAWVNYVHDYCFIQSTYFVPELDDMYKIQSEASTQEVAYYQWVPYVLFFIPFLFFIPKIFWAFTVSHFCSLNLDAIIDHAEEVNKDTSEKREEGVKKYGESLKTHLDVVYLNRYFRAVPWTIFCYIITKWLYAVIAALIISLLKIFVNQDNIFWGFKIVFNSLAASRWQRLDTFPYITFCKTDRVVDFANSQADTMQCLLVMNMLYDKVLVFLSIWMLIVFAIAVSAALYESVYYTWTLISPSLGNILKDAHVHSHNRFKRFVNKHIHAEGILVFQILREKVSPMFAHEVADAMWKSMVDTETNGLALHKSE